MRNSNQARAGAREYRPQVMELEARALLSTVATGAPTALMTVTLGRRFAPSDAAEGVTHRRVVMLHGRTLPDQLVGMRHDGQAKFTHMTRAGALGKFRMAVMLKPGANPMTFATMGDKHEHMSTLVVVKTSGTHRPFTGSPTPGNQPFAHLIPNSVSYAPGLPPRPSATSVSQGLAEDPNHPSFSKNIELGMVFFGQFVDHDMTLDDVPGQGPNADPTRPINIRTPALDLDPVYGRGPHDQPEFYTPDGLFFRQNAGGKDHIRDAQGVAIIGDPRNDDNGLIANVHLAFERFHNVLMTQALRGADPNSLTTAQKDALFDMVHDEVVGYYQGIVTHEFGTAILGRPISDREPPIANVPVEFSGAVFRMGHSLVPNVIVVDHQGTQKSPTDPGLRGPDNRVPLDLLFGDHAQRAAALDDKVSNTMRTLLIPISPTSSAPGDLIGGNSPNIGQGQIIDGVMHLDLGETNILRGRELKLPSGEEYLAMLEHRPYHPATDGNTDLFAYILHEATPLGHLGKVGTDVVERAIGGLLAGDPYRFDNPDMFSHRQIDVFRHATFEKLLHAIGEPGF